MSKRATPVVSNLALIVALAGLGGCSGGMSGLYGSAATETATPVALDASAAPKINLDTDAECPVINVPSGSSSYASYAGPASPLTVRFEATIAQFARECVLRPGNMVQIRIGVEGRVLLGEKGAPGTFPAPLRISVRDRNGTVVATSQKRVSVTVPAGDTQGTFRIVDDSAVVPISPDKPLRSYDITIGFDTGAPVSAPKKRRG